MNAKQNSILIVDDDIVNISAIMNILGQDYTVYAEKDSENCVALVKKLKPDLILLDIIMPGISGFDIMRFLKSDTDTADIPVIFLTGKTEPDNEVLGFDLGAVDYINKPFNSPVVRMRIAHQIQIINQRRRLDSLREAEEIERQRKEQKRINERINLILDSAPISIEIYDLDGRILDCNNATLRMHGFGHKTTYMEAYNKMPGQFYPESQPCGSSSAALLAAYFTEANECGKSVFEWVHRTYDGVDFPTEVSMSKIEHEDIVFLVAHVYDLREIKRLEQERLETLQETSDARSRFFARMSHEIRTPVTAVMGISEVHLRRRNMPHHIEDAFARIYDSSKILLHIVNDILDMSKIESGKMSLLNSVYDIEGLISETSQLHMVYLERKDVTFRLYVDENLPARLYGDALRLRQILNNLLTNAFKYTSRGHVIMSIHAERTEEDSDEVTLAISIRDTGKGMTAEQIEIIKEEYVRIHEIDNHLISGTGLGMPIVYSLVQLMDASMDLQSELGKGTDITLRIPQKTVGNEKVGAELARLLQDFERGTWFGAKDFEAATEIIPKLSGSILVVDDAETNRYVAEAMLEAFGLNIELCESGICAVERIKAGMTYDIIFMDHMMPEMDGIEATQTIRTLGYGKPIIALTANAFYGQTEMFLENGFSGFMTKPIDMQILRSFLIKYIPEIK